LTGAPLSSGPFRGHDASISIESSPDGSVPPHVDWVAHRTDVSAENIRMDRNHDPGPRRNDPDLLTSVHVDGNVAEFGLDVTGQSEFLGNGPFRPTIRVWAGGWQVPPPGQPDVFSYQQFCRWDSPVTDQSGPSSEATVAPANPYPAPQPQPVPTAPSQPPQSNASAAGQIVRTESGRARCAVGGDDPHGGGPAVVCEATPPLNAPPDPDQIGFPQAPTDPPLNCPPPPGTFLRCTPPIHWDLAVVHASGAFNWAEGNIPGTPQVMANDVVLNYGRTYHIAGCTILPSGDGTRFTNDNTSHGMSVSIENVQPF
jgi:hypothetical protein